MCSESAKCFVILIVFLKQIITGASQINCNCIPLQECGTFVNLLGKLEKPLSPSVVEFLRSRQCGFLEGHPKVCCSDVQIVSNKHQQQLHKKTCEAKSDCTILKNCAPYMNLIGSMEKPLKASVVDFLRSQECGFDSGYPKVCCSLLPKSFAVLKHAGPETRHPFRKLSAELSSENTLGTDSRDVITTERAPRRTTVRRRLKTKADVFNEAFSSDFFDITGTFDLMLRRKRYDSDGSLDIEIR